MKDLFKDFMNELKLIIIFIVFLLFSYVVIKLLISRPPVELYDPGISCVLFSLKEGLYLPLKWTLVCFSLIVGFFGDNDDKINVQTRYIRVIVASPIVLYQIYNVTSLKAINIDEILLLSCLALFIYRYCFSFILLNVFLLYTKFSITALGFSIIDQSMNLLLLSLFALLSIFSFINRLLLDKPKYHIKLNLPEWKYLFLLVFSFCYFIPFVEKLRISPNFYDWVVFEDLGKAFLEYYFTGWRLGLTIEQASTLSRYISKVSFLLTMSAFLVEISPLLLFTGFRYKKLVVLMCVILHILIFVISGILFWKWIIVCMLFLLPFNFFDEKFSIFCATKKFNLSFILFLISCSYFVSFSVFPKLGWFTGEKFIDYAIIAKTNDGNYEIPNHFFSPYELVTTFERYDFLNDLKSIDLSDNYKSTSYSYADIVNNFNNILNISTERFYDKKIRHIYRNKSSDYPVFNKNLNVQTICVLKRVASSTNLFKIKEDIIYEYNID